MKAEVTNNGKSMVTTVEDCKSELEMAIFQGRNFMIFEREYQRTITSEEALSFSKVSNTGNVSCKPRAYFYDNEVVWSFEFGYNTHISFLSTPPGVFKEKDELLEATENATQTMTHAPAKKMRL
jgi:hypothetical protein